MAASQQSLLDASHRERRSTPGILTPDSESSPISPNSRKRKREAQPTKSPEHLLQDTFVVRPHRSLVHAKPRVLTPFLLLPRSDLPLSYLDNGASSSVLPQSRFFESHIKILELEARLGSGPTVLIAGLDDGKSIYAVEREDRGLYVFCKLGSWVDLATLKRKAVVSRPGWVIKTSAIDGGGKEKCAEAEVSSMITPESSKYSKKQKLAIDAIKSMMRRTASEPSAGTTSSEVSPVAQTPPKLSDGLEPQRPDEPIPSSEVVEPTAAGLLDAIRIQYLEALYLSKASLAYFPKGPLSRARAAFHLDLDSTLHMQDLIEFLESMVLSTSTMDKKFKTTLPETVNKVIVEFLSADEASKPSTKRKSKKVKPGKNGLYHCEEELIRKWIDGYKQDDDDDSGFLNNSKIKGLVAELRARETRLQVIVLLEILALKSLDMGTMGDEALPSAAPSSSSESKTKERLKGKKPAELEAILDVHIDRLCIWQEVSGSSGYDGSLFEASGGLAGIGNYEENPLRDFCVEIIAPFFSARLPDLAATVNRKLGGPLPQPPPRPKLTKSKSTSGLLPRPGAAAKRTGLDRSSQNLQRVLNNERRARSVSRATPDSAAIALMRSVSTSNGSVPRLKREASEALSLASIPTLDSQSSRSEALKRRYSQREVEMSVPPRAAADLKIKKQAALDAELREAIAALKKPNRQLAGKVLVETAEQRAASASKSMRKTNKPVRNPIFQDSTGVQIMATPRKGARAPPRSHANNTTPTRSPQDKIPASSATRIPDSIIRPRSSNLFPEPSSRVPHAHPPREENPFNIADTPTRPPSRSHGWTEIFPSSSPTYTRRRRNSTSQNGDINFAIPDSVARNPFAEMAPNKRRTTTEIIESTPTKPSRKPSFAPSVPLEFSQPPSRPVSGNGTKPKLTDAEEQENSAPPPPPPPPLSPNPSPKSRLGNRHDDDDDDNDIYKRLGWDDDNFDDLD